MKNQHLVLSLLSLLHASTACLCGLAALQTRDTNETITAGSPASLALTNVRVFDGHQVGPPQTLVIDGGLIVENDTKANMTMDAGGRILIPGLIESHTHVQDTTSMKQFTSYGVTTVANMACHNYTTCAALRDLPGLALFITAGFPAIGPNSSHAISQKLAPDQLFYSPSQAPSAVQYAVGNNSDFYKITAEINGPSQQSQNLLVQDCHAKGILSMTHASYTFSFQQAIASDTDGIQHIPSDGLITREMIDTLIKQGQTVTPTINIFKQAVINPALLSLIGSSTTTNMTQNVSIVEQNTRLLHQAGAKLLAGTDSIGAVGGGIDVPFGSTLHLELQNLVQIGMSPAEALRAATSEPAASHRLHDRGIITPGMRADLVLLNSDPLANISNTLDIAKVWAGGIEYAPVATTPANNSTIANSTAAAASALPAGPSSS